MPKSFQLVISIGARCKGIGMKNIHIGLKDDNDLDIEKDLSHVTALVLDHLAANKVVMLHCQAGINRSPSFALAIVCKYLNISVEEGIQFINSKRRVCRFSFQDQVARWLHQQQSQHQEISGP